MTNTSPHILIISANFYPDITGDLLVGARAELIKMNVSFDEIEVPGAFEIPAAINFAIQSKKYDGYIALGCVIRGETSHYDYVCGESARGIMDLALHKNAAIGYGILTVENIEQAFARANIAEGNKGKDVVEACLKLIAIKNQFGIKQ
ncbi:MAG: 6,7-dimethyl-8-ribityllumazine synthase [Rickettsiales bacterium]|jgi:6,7-dimethyl-8-ribityllumazine synthase